MLANIIDGKHHARNVLTTVAQDVEQLKGKGIEPQLVIIMIGDNPASKIYVRNKMTVAQSLGIATNVITFDSGISEDELLNAIEILNNNALVHGILVQLPISASIDTLKIFSAIAPEKDVDGFHPINVGLHNLGSKQAFVPCTALGIMHLISAVESNLNGKNVVIVGRSMIVGRPLNTLLINHNCTTTLCNSYTRDLAAKTLEADIVVVAIGRANMMGCEYFSTNQIVIDVGINQLLNTKKIVGDVNFDQVSHKVAHITPVPGGVGPMTVAYLMHNTIKAAQQH